MGDVAEMPFVAAAPGTKWRRGEQPKVYVLAHTMMDFRDWCKKYGVSPEQAVFVQSRETLCGALVRRYAVDDSFWYRDDAGELLDLLNYVKSPQAAGPSLAHVGANL